MILYRQMAQGYKFIQKERPPQQFKSGLNFFLKVRIYQFIQNMYIPNNNAEKLTDRMKYTERCSIGYGLLVFE